MHIRRSAVFVIAAAVTFLIAHGSAGAKPHADGGLAAPAASAPETASQKVPATGPRLATFYFGYGFGYPRHRYYGYGGYYGYPYYYGGYPYYYDSYPYYSRRYYRKRSYRKRRSYRGRSCRHWKSRCTDNWGYRNSDYYGCMRYHGCD